MRKLNRSKRGQGMTEYIIIVCIVAVAALAVVGLFGDQIRALFGGAVVQLGGDSGEVEEATSTKSTEFLKSFDEVD